MNQTLFDLSTKLSESIKNDPLFIELESLEKQLNDNEEVIQKSYKKDVICAKYSDLLKIYAEDSDEISNVRKELSQAKEELYSIPIVKRYLEVYSEIKKILFEVNSILLDDYK